MAPALWPERDALDRDELYPGSDWHKNGWSKHRVGLSAEWTCVEIAQTGRIPVNLAVSQVLFSQGPLDRAGLVPQASGVRRPRMVLQRRCW